MQDSHDSAAATPHPTSSSRPSKLPSAIPSATASYQPMMHIPQASTYSPDKTILGLGSEFYDIVKAANFLKTILRFRNDRWAAAVGLDSLDDEEWLAHFGRFIALPDNLPDPLALRYHGHQFRVYNPDIGDG